MMRPLLRAASSAGWAKAQARGRGSWCGGRRRAERTALAVVALITLSAAPAIKVAPPEPPSGERLNAALDALVAAYPQALERHDGQRLIWKSGPPTPVASSGLDAAGTVARPGVADIFAWPYPLKSSAAPLGDPGRARPAAFFTRLYGDCRSGGVEPRLVPVRWAGGKSVRFTSVAGAATALDRVARDLDRLGPIYAKYLWPIAGTYNCRTIAGTASLSMHAYGAAIDLNSQWGAYWRWSARPNAAQTIPPAIIEAFERHGFIWGGKWAHFDSFHFEYRPELILFAQRSRR